MPHERFYSRAGKRVLDAAMSGALMVVLAPIGAVLALVISVTLGRPVLFRQRRPGRNGASFHLIKLRTMTDARHADGRLLPDADRLHPIGRFLRSTSLDELPELWNVLVGEMSLVGPRPLLEHYLPLYSPRQSRRHDVRPGITGLAQVSGRNAIDWETRLEFDVQYVDRVSLRLDLWILARTVMGVLRRKGISQPGRATVDEFRGSGQS